MKPSFKSLLHSSLIFAIGTIAAHAASFSEPIGLQLYSLRADFAKDVPGTLAKVHGYGIRNVLQNLQQFKPKAASR